MKKIILSILFLFTISFCNAQVVKYDAIYMNIRLFNDTTQQFYNWEGWEECQLVVKIDLKTLVITINSEKEQVYDIQSLLEKEQDHVKRISTFKALDVDKGECIIILIRIFPTQQEYLHINWRNLQLAYEIKRQ